MRRSRWSVPVTTIVLAVLASAAPTLAEGKRFLIGIEGGFFEPSGFSASYDAVYGETLVPLGARIEWAFRPRFAVALATSFTSANGELVAVLPGEEPVSTGIATELELNPWQLTFAWRIDPEGPWSGFVGLGPTWMRFQESNEFEKSSVDAIGAHLAAGLRRSFGRIVVGAEVDYSTIPDAIGESGAAAAFGEDDLGGVTAKLLVGYAF